MVILSIFLVITCVLLTLVILSQNSKGGGLSGQFGGNSGTSQVLGAKRTSDFLEKATWVLIATLFIVSFFSPKAALISNASEQPNSILEQINSNTIDSQEEIDSSTEDLDISTDDTTPSEEMPKDNEAETDSESSDILKNDSLNSN